MVLSLDSLSLDVNSEVLLAPHCLVCTLCWHVPLIGSAGTLCGTCRWHALWHMPLARSVAPLHMQ